MQIIVKNLRLPISVPIEEAFSEAAKRLGLRGSELSSAKFALHKRSIDARRRSGHGLEFVYSVSVECELSEKKLSKLKPTDFEAVKRQSLELNMGKRPLEGRPLIVGFGPCGMFAALLLAENGYAPIVIERGADIEKRQKSVDHFNRTGELDEASNIQFGAGGAGTFSDGKLVTRINDPRCTYVLERFHEFGAPAEILTLAKPHVGTDRLVCVVDSIKKRIESLGGEIRFETKLKDIRLGSGRVESVSLENNGAEYELSPGVVILAVGHSARDTYEMLDCRGIELIPKPFSVGVRVEHLQSDIDRMLYGADADKYDRSILPPGEYSLSHRERQEGLVSDNARGVYSFCMCPGGEVVAAASELGGVVTNGMSRYARDGRNANSAIAVSVFPEDIGKGWRDGIEFQRGLEKRAFIAGGGDYTAPIELLGDFLEGRSRGLREPSRVLPTYRSGEFVKPTALDELFPDFVSDMLKKGLVQFGRKMQGFDSPEAVLTGVETRTSSPVRLLRGEDGCALTDNGSSVDNLYTCGEGAGYAGGITSAAVDGVHAAQRVMERYKNFS